MYFIKNYNQHELFITGVGITSAIGVGKNAFISALLQGQHAFGVMKRSGRQKETLFIGAEIPSLSFSDKLSKRLLRAASFSGQVALSTLHEAWENAELDGMDPSHIGLVVGGSNLQQRELIRTFESFAKRVHFLRPSYGLSFMDSDICGLCTEQFGIKGFAYTLGGASASGQMAIIKAIEAIQGGYVKVCIALGALMDLSFLECQGFRSLGAMGTDLYADQPQMACRPFDKNRDGFIYGESCGAVVIEKADTALSRRVKPYAAISGWAMGVDGNRNPNPSCDGEVRVIKEALNQARLSTREIDYINPHGTGSVIGDEIELRAISNCQLSHAYINATKSLTGHGLSAAGTVEVIATLLQMKESRLHPTRNLDNPIDTSLTWVRDQAISHVIKHALNLSFGFGGINTAICLKNIEK
jgi:malonyl-ACP decarboxylase